MTEADQQTRVPARPVRRGREGALVLGVFAVLGLGCGVLWSIVVTPADFTKVAGGGAMGETDLGRQFAADGWFVVIGLVTALVAGLVLAARRTRDAVLTTALMVLGSVLAAVLMSLVGHLLGPADPQAALKAARIGAKVPEALSVGTSPVWPLTTYLRDTAVVYLVWPIGVLAGALFMLLGRGPGPDEADSSNSPRAGAFPA